MEKNILTVKNASEILGVKPDAVRKALRSGRLQGKKFGPVWMVYPASVENFSRGKPGPKKTN